jgi:hypothetical protein
MSSYLDTRDLEERRVELAEMEERDAEEQAELEELHALRDEVGSEWEDGVTMIPEVDFGDFASQEAYDLGYLAKGSAMEYYIDWEKWERDMRHDYSEVEFWGETYLHRNG